MIEITSKGKVIVGFFVSLLILLIYFNMNASTMKPMSRETGTPEGSVTGFYKVSPQDAEQLLKQNPSMIVVDCSATAIDFIAGRKLPKAVWSPDARVYYNQRIVLLIYGSSDDESTDYARSLVGKMYGEIYVLMGGYQAWHNWINRVQ